MTLLAFGAVSLRLLDLGVPEGCCCCCCCCFYAVDVTAARQDGVFAVSRLAKPAQRTVHSQAGLLRHKMLLEARPRRGVPARVSLPKSRAEALLAALNRGRSLVASVEQRGKVLLLSETDEDKLVPAGHGAKPHPDPYLIAMERLGVPAHDCVVFEDSRSGVRAGVAANVAAVVGVRSELGDEDLRGAGAQVTVGDWTEVTPQLLERLLLLSGT